MNGEESRYDIVYNGMTSIYLNGHVHDYDVEVRWLELSVTNWNSFKTEEDGAEQNSFAFTMW